ncbi:MAG: peptidylprolyl isomerase [Terriglobales bacterium]
MRSYLILLFLLGTDAGVLVAQTATAATSQVITGQTSPATAESSVRPEDAVITLRGVCSGPAGAADDKKADCKTVVSRREFEFLSDSINLGGKTISMGARQNLAKTYAEYLVYEQPAKQAGLENTERYAEIMRWLRLRMLTDLLREKIVEEYRSPSDAEVAHYYQEHIIEFERVHIARIMVPRNVSGDGEMGNGATGERDKKLLALANEARERVVKGDDPEQIQKDVYRTLGIGAVPPTDLGNQARKDFVSEESAELFSLKAGDVSKVETELASFVIYKVISKETLSENEVKDQISREMARRNIEKANQAITQSVEPVYNEKYFGPPVAEPLVPGKPAHP